MARSSRRALTPRSTIHDVFEPGGTCVGQVQVPANVTFAVRRGDLVWENAYDDDDAAFVKRYRIDWR